MEYLQYSNKVTELVETVGVLNLVINGIPSILTSTGDYLSAKWQF